MQPRVPEWDADLETRNDIGLVHLDGSHGAGCLDFTVLVGIVTCHDVNLRISNYLRKLD